MKNHFIEFLKGLQNELIFKSNISDYDIGYRCASGCINDIIDTRIGLLLDETENVQKCDLFIEDCINNILWVINATLEDKTEDNDFNNGYKQKADEVIQKLENYKTK